MKILFFLTPKSEVAYIHDDESLRQVLEKMEYHKYSAVPIISRQGTYVGTITEGDLLWYIKNQLDLNLQEARRILITNVPRRSDNTPVSIDSNMEDLLDKAMKQNFVPVLDDKKSFIGIVTRKDIMKYFADKMKKTE
ncbi:MAG: CBS domain-containing protein [Enterocloster sp.]